MLVTGIPKVLKLFDPIGNTPAVSLTQDLPPQKNADVLLLGCGDVRHILFTIHTEHLAHTRRSLDITCCDVEKTAIARNILLVSLILDDVNGTNEQLIWNLVCHFRIDEASLGLLQTQTAKLLALSSSLKKWEQTQYGRVVRICDRVSLERVRDVWRLYAERREQNLLRHFNERLNDGRKISQEFRKFVSGEGLNVVSEIRASAPACLEASHDLGALYRNYWDSGTTETDKTTRSLAVHSSPMFWPENIHTLLHHDTNPVLGFHIGSCYIPIEQTSPRSGSSQKPELHEIVNSAKTEFQTWMKSFRAYSHADLVTLRFFVGDQIAFAYALQQMRTAGPSKPSHWYRDRYHFDPLVLDDEHYLNCLAPLVSDIIDTSYYIDHFGGLNLLTATSPLLRHDSWATLYSEGPMCTHETQPSILGNYLGGETITVTSLLGLVPVEAVTNTAPSSAGMETLSQAVLRPSSKARPVVARTAWKRPPNLSTAVIKTLDLIHFDSFGLAKVLHHVFLKMFANEDVLQSVAKVASGQSPSQSTYNRASFVAFLCLVKTRTSTDWNKTMEALIDLIDQDTTLAIAHVYKQETYLWMHMKGLYSLGIFNIPPNAVNFHGQTGALQSWRNMPPIVSVTLRVPRSKLSPFISKVIKVGCTPPLHGILESSPRSANQWQHMFAATQIGFGILKTKGFRFSNSFELEINEDQVGWSGNSPMFLSFYVPSWILLQEPRIATVSFAIEHSPAAIEAFGGDVERDLNIFTAMQNDVEHVYITKRQPHQSQVMTMCGFAPGDVKNHVDPQGNSETTITATVNENTGVISSFTSRVKIISEQPKALLRDGSGIKRSLRSPFSYALSLQKGPSFIATFPSPVLDSTARVKIARKSSYLELVADVAKPNDWPTLRSSMYPVLLDEGSHVLWNLPRLNLSSLPIIDLSSASSKGPMWLQQLLTTMLSERELALNLDSPLAASPSVRAKLEFKNMLVNMFASFGQSDGRNVQIYTIDCYKERGVQMVFFLSKLLLDVSNRTAVLDAAVLPVHADDLMDVTRALIALSDIGHPPKGLRTSQDVMWLWKEALPAWTERCRTWDHKPSCEYVATGIIPLSVKYGERVLCSCGEGTVPTGFMPDFTPWEDLAKHAVRVAISPAFPSVLVEKPLTELPDLQICQVCAKEKADNGSDLSTCSRCRKTKYCSKECQKADWKEHKKVCKADGN